MHRGYLLTLIAVVCVSVAAVVFALRTDPAEIGEPVDPENLPELADGVPGPELAAGWIGSEPLADEDLAGSVVVYDFWTYSCVNCVRTIPYLRSWYERYRDEGLVIIGVHSPEFEFEKDAGNVARAVEELGVSWPVALDPEMAVWQAFGNRYWPAKYVVDRAGVLRYVHFGEGAYDETEDVLRFLLGVDPASPRADDGGDDQGESPGRPGEQTPELYLGHLRGVTASPEGLADPDGDGRPGGEVTFTVPSVVAADSFALGGRWTVDGESATAAEAGAAIVLRYRGSEVNLVLGTEGGAATTVLVSLDGGEAREVAVGDLPDLVNLLTDGPAGEHELRIEATEAGLSAYAFTFGTAPAGSG